MASLDVIRNLTIRATTEGVDQAAASVNKLTGAQEGLAAASVKTEKATLSVDAALARTERRYDQEANAAKQLAQVQQTLNAAREAGRISQQRQNELMSLAIRAHNTAGAAAKQHSQALEELSNASQSLAGNLGAVGGILARMGPAGLAVAGTLGLVAAAATAAATASLGLADFAGKLVDLSDSTGFTVVGLQALQQAASQVGVSEEQLTSKLERMTATFGKLRESDKGTIKTFESLGEGMAQAGANATSAEAQFDFLGKALKNLDVNARAQALQGIFGKGSAGIGRVLDLTEAAGGIQAFLAQMDKAGVITRKQAEEFDNLGDAIKRAFKVASIEFVKGFAGPTLENLQAVSQQLVIVAKLAGEVVAPMSSAFGGTVLENITTMRDALTEFNASLAGLSDTEKRTKIGEALIDPRLIQAVNDLIDVFKTLVDVIKAAGAALSAFFSNPFSFASIGQIFTDMSSSIDAAKAAVQRLGTTLSTEGTRGAQALKPIEVSAEGVDTAIDGIVDGIKGLPKDLGLKFEVPPAILPKRLEDAAASGTKLAKAVKEEVNPVLKELGSVAGQLGSSLVSAFLSGKSAGEALNSTLKSISSSAASSAINKLVNLDFTGAAVGGLAGGKAAQMFGAKAKPEKADNERAQLPLAA